MKKESAVIVFLSILLVVSNIAWLTYYSLLQQEEKRWMSVGSAYSGDENTLTTEAYKITGEEWRIDWSFSGSAEGAICEVTVYDAYTDSEIKTFSLTYDQREGYSNLKGRFYLKLRFYGYIENWIIHVKEYR